MLEGTIEILDALASFSIIPARTVLVRTARHGTGEGVPGIDHHSWLKEWRLGWLGDVELRQSQTELRQPKGRLCM